MIGLLFYVRPDQDFMDALRWGMDYYRKRLSQEPKVCIVNPATEMPVKPPLEIKAAPYILVRNFWILYEEQDEYNTYV